MFSSGPFWPISAFAKDYNRPLGVIQLRTDEH